jgi:hypothetical protein
MIRGSDGPASAVRCADRARTSDAQRAARVAPHVTSGPHSSAMRDVTSPVLDRLDAGRGELHALQVLLGLFVLLLIL